MIRHIISIISLIAISAIGLTIFITEHDIRHLYFFLITTLLAIIVYLNIRAELQSK